MNARARVRGVAATALLVLLCLPLGCRSQPAIPAGYVPLEEQVWGECLVSAVASSGNRYEVREHENPEGGTLEFWVDAVRRELVDARGYECIGERDCPRGGIPGRELSFEVQNGLERYAYLVAVYLDGDRVLVGEAGGEAEAFARDLDVVRAAIDRLPEAF